MTTIAIFPSKLALLFAAALLVALGLAKLMQLCFHNAVDILEYPQKLAASYTARKVKLLLLLLPAYGLSVHWIAELPKLVMALVFCTFMIFISVMDWEQQIIPDNVLLLLLLLALLFSPVIPAPFINRICAAGIGGLVMLLLAILTKGGVGGGDIKLLFVLGLWLGTDKLLGALLSGFVSAGIVSAVLLVIKLRKPKDTIAYGPYFALSAIYYLLF